MSEIETDDELHFFSLEENDTPLNLWELAYQHKTGNDRLYKLHDSDLEMYYLVLVSFASSDGNGNCWESDSLFVDVIFKATIKHDGMQHIYFNSYLCGANVEAIADSLKLVHDLSASIEDRAAN